MTTKVENLKNEKKIENVEIKRTDAERASEVQAACLRVGLTLVGRVKSATHPAIPVNRPVVAGYRAIVTANKIATWKIVDASKRRTLTDQLGHIAGIVKSTNFRQTLTEQLADANAQLAEMISQKQTMRAIILLGLAFRKKDDADSIPVDEVTAKIASLPVWRIVQSLKPEHIGKIRQGGLGNADIPHVVAGIIADLSQADYIRDLMDSLDKYAADLRLIASDSQGVILKGKAEPLQYVQAACGIGTTVAMLAAQIKADIA